MKNQKTVISLWLLSCLFCCTRLFAQKVVRVQEPYVLLDTDREIGNIGDEIRIEREIKGRMINIGTIKLVRFQKGQAAGRIMRLTKPYRILVGDRISILPPKQTAPLELQSVSVSKENVYVKVLRVAPPYVLLSGGSQTNITGDRFQVHRKTEGGLETIGMVEIVKTVQGKTAARIIDQFGDNKIQEGDFIPPNPPEADIDTYFFNSLKTW